MFTVNLQDIHGKFQPYFTICVLLYGNNTKLAARCLKSILELAEHHPIELRVGMNAVCEDTLALVKGIYEKQSSSQLKILLYNSTINRGKYPMMRWMLHDPVHPINTPYIMWFDDDSYIRTPTANWIKEIMVLMPQCDICGAVMQCRLAGNQPLWITMQPWYNGKPVKFIDGNPYVTQFIVGGWWVIKTTAINKLDWPPQNIIHRGGDFMLGEAMRQHDLSLRNYNIGIAINADDKGENHKAPRRGMDPLPIGVDYVPPLTVLAHDATKAIEPKLLDMAGI